MPEPITIDPGEPESPQYARRVASAIAEGVRTLNHHTMDPTGALQEPADVDAVVTELATAAMRLPQLLGQISAWLHWEQDTGRLAVNYGPNAGDPQEAVTQATTWLEKAGAAAGQLHQALDAARQITATIGGVYDPAEDPDA